MPYISNTRCVYICLVFLSNGSYLLEGPHTGFCLNSQRTHHITTFIVQLDHKISDDKYYSIVTMKL